MDCFQWFFAVNKLNRLLNLEEILEKKLVRPECGESPVAPPVPEYSSAVLFRGLVCPEWKVDRDGTFLGKCLADLTAGVILGPSGSGWAPLSVDDGPGLETDALFTWPLPPAPVELPRVNSDTVVVKLLDSGGKTLVFSVDEVFS